MWTWETLATADKPALEAAFAAGTLPDAAVLDGRRYRGYNHGPVMKVITQKFVKTFRREADGDWGNNLVVKQDRKAWRGEWELKLRNGAPVPQGHYSVTPEGSALHLDYAVARNTGADLITRVIQDDVVCVDAGDHDLLLGKANFRLGPVRSFVCFFQLQRLDPLP